MGIGKEGGRAEEEGWRKRKRGKRKVSRGSRSRDEARVYNERGKWETRGRGRQCQALTWRQQQLLMGVRCVRGRVERVRGCGLDYTY